MTHKEVEALLKTSRAIRDRLQHAIDRVEAEQTRRNRLRMSGMESAAQITATRIRLAELDGIIRAAFTHARLEGFEAPPRLEEFITGFIIVQVTAIAIS
jgi:hypothetical protein